MLISDQINLVVQSYAAATAEPLARLSQRALRDPRVLPGVVGGSRTVTVLRADTLIQWLSDHWPDGVVWPPSVPRPEPSLAEASA